MCCALSEAARQLAWMESDAARAIVDRCCAVLQAVLTHAEAQGGLPAALAEVRDARGGGGAGGGGRGGATPSMDA